MRETMLFEEDSALDRGEGEPVLIVDVDGFEGPLDLLLELARRHKLDLVRISMLALAEQYIAFIEQARRMRLELAADYLVMAAWLTYLKSRLLLPEKKQPEEPSAAELASDLAMRLRRLEAMRLAARRLAERDQLGRDIFARGAPEDMATIVRPAWQASLYDLLAAYARQRQTRALSAVTIRRRVVWGLQEARDILERLVGLNLDWAPLDAYLGQWLADPEARTTVRASAFAAALEMVREGKMDVRQDAPFAPLYLRGRAAAAVAA
jgi:segregation and condensation protein A